MVGEQLGSREASNVRTASSHQLSGQWHSIFVQDSMHCQWHFVQLEVRLLAGQRTNALLTEVSGQRQYCTLVASRGLENGNWNGIVGQRERKTMTCDIA